MRCNNTQELVECALESARATEQAIRDAHTRACGEMPIAEVELMRLIVSSSALTMQLNRLSGAITADNAMRTESDGS